MHMTPRLDEGENDISPSIFLLVYEWHCYKPMYLII